MRWRRRRRAARRCAGGARDHLHARQGSGAVRARHARRAVESARRGVMRDEAGVVAEVRRRAGIDSRLPGARRRRGGRLSRAAGLGSEVAAAVLARYGHLEAIPEDWRTWGVNAASPAALAATLAARARPRIAVPRLATLRTDIPLFESWTSCSGTARRRRVRRHSERGLTRR